MTIFVAAATNEAVLPVPDEDFGIRIGRLRRLAGLSGRKLSALAGLKANGHAASIERLSPDRISMETVAKIADVFGVSVDWLYRGRGKLPSDRRILAAVAEAQARMGG